MSNKKSNWHILVTGGAGFIGSNFILYMMKRYPTYKITNFDALTYAGNLKNLKEVKNNHNYKFVKGSILDAKLVHKLVKECDIIVHFAAESHVDRSIINTAKFAETNIMGTVTLLEAARNQNLKRFHHISSIEVYGGLHEGKLINEKTPYDPRHPYAAFKASADNLIRAYFYTFNLPITISNSTNNYGPRQFPEKLIPLSITNLIKGKKIPLYGDGSNMRDWVYVEDHCAAIDLIIHRGKIGESYCIGCGCRKTNIEVARSIAQMLGYGDEMIKFIKDRPSHDRCYAVDSTKIKKELGWQPKITFEDGLKRTVKWYQENQNWWKKIK